MPLLNATLGVLTSSIVAAAFLVSYSAVNEAIPSKEARRASQDAASTIRKEDRLQAKKGMENVQSSPQTTAVADSRLMRLCSTADGQMFGWQWPNVPFAAMACDNSQAPQRGRSVRQAPPASNLINRRCGAMCMVHSHIGRDEL